MIDLQSVGGFLFSIDSRKVKEHIRHKLVQYQREMTTVMTEYLFGQRKSTDLNMEMLSSILASNQQMLAALLAGQQQMMAMMTRMMNHLTGHRRTNADKRQEVESALRNPANAQLTDRQIDEMCDVSPGYASRVRKTVARQTPGPNRFAAPSLN